MNKKKTVVYAKKRFGQNFLVDHQVLNNIIKSLHLQKQHRVLEIGPGRGALTQLLLQNLEHLYAVELDWDLTQLLQQKFSADKLTLYSSDILKFDLCDFLTHEKKTRIVGNLPYNISTEVLFRLLSFRTHIQDMHFMLQKEVVDRLAASPGNKTYGKLSILIQYFFDVTPLFQVLPSSFKPRPKVYSAYVRLKPKATIAEATKNYDLFKKIVTSAFQQRRKTLKNALSVFFTEKQLLDAQLDPQARPETLSINDYVRLSNL